MVLLIFRALEPASGTETAGPVGSVSASCVTTLVLESRNSLVASQSASWVPPSVSRRATGEYSWHQSLWNVDGLGREGNGDVVDKLGVPPLLDAIVHEGHETRSHDDTVCRSGCQNLTDSSPSHCEYLLGNIGKSTQHALVRDPHEAGWHPSASVVVSGHLIRRARFRHYECHREA